MECVGIGDIVGVVYDQIRGYYVPTRSQAWFIRAFTHGWTVSELFQGVIRVDPAYGLSGTRYGDFSRRAPHRGEDVFFGPNTPIISPLDAAITSVSPAVPGADYGKVVSLQTNDCVNLRLRIAHIWVCENIKPGVVVKKGDLLGHLSRRPHLPNGSPTHIHLESIVGEGSVGNQHPFSALDLSALLPLASQVSMSCGV